MGVTYFNLIFVIFIACGRLFYSNYFSSLLLVEI
jgi:hypothetical protein